MTGVKFIEKALVEIISVSSEHTFDIGLAIGRKAHEGDTFALSGELGSGKTCFTGGLARGLDIGQEYSITSPTFTLINEYSGRCRLYHFDVYRLTQAGDLDDIGYDEYVSGKGVVVIEWAEKIEEALPADAIRIKFVYLEENKRKLILQGPENRIKKLICDI
jgi:tRNA threonylcarbamoyladenosine biosynthesis protein TsaE